jgi:outer membrane lipoprotein carrier protein
MSVSSRRWRYAVAGVIVVAVTFNGAGGLPASPFSPVRDTPAVDDYVTRLESAYREIKTLRAQFTQSYTAGGRARTESGIVYFARGGKMRWNYRQPEEKLFLSNGKELILYVPSEKQVTRSRVKSSEDARVPFRLLLSRLNLRKVFGRIEFDDQALKPLPGNRVLVGRPKHQEQDEFREVVMELTPAFDIHRLLIRYDGQGTMEFTFDQIERNVALSPTLFTFSPPAGTEVIDQGE